MTKFVPKIPKPELFLGFVAPIGASLEPALRSFRGYLESHGYEVEEVKVTNIFRAMAPYVQPKQPLVPSPKLQRYKSYIAYGNQLREHFNDDAILAATAIGQIVRRRTRLKRSKPSDQYAGTAYLIHQFKRKEEIELLRAVYGRLFFQVSVYQRRGSRVEALARKFAASENSARAEKYRFQAEEIVQVDAEEVGETHGQRVAKIFHDADFIVGLDSTQPTSDEQIVRFCELLFSSNSVSPSKSEYGMFAAKAAALRTLDLSRQVGAAIFTPEGEVICMGSNEVPTGAGGTYWPETGFDARDYKLEADTNETRKKQMLTELAEMFGGENAEKLLANSRVKDSQFMDALEYGRIVHAEMSAITDAARLGRPIRGGVLYCTTFPCHMCAKHIVAAGLSKVIFLEPYPKSLAAELHSDSLQVEGADRGQYSEYPAVRFEHFFGITPRRYRELFERARRKNDDGNFIPYANGAALPIIDIKVPFYTRFEDIILEVLKSTIKYDQVFSDSAMPED
jgi:deoxycytidylate deaminase